MINLEDSDKLSNEQNESIIVELETTSSLSEQGQRSRISSSESSVDKVSDKILNVREAEPTSTSTLDKIMERFKTFSFEDDVDIESGISKVLNVLRNENNSNSLMQILKEDCEGYSIDKNEFLLVKACESFPQEDTFLDIQTRILNPKSAKDHALRNPWILKCIKAGLLSLQQMDDFTWAGCCVLKDVKVQHFLELECNLQYIGCVVSLSDPAGSALQNGWVRDCLTDGKLTWQQLTRMTWSGENTLCDPELQIFLELPQNRNYISQIAKFSDGAAVGLKNESLLVEACESFSQEDTFLDIQTRILNPMSAKDHALRNPWILKCIKAGLLSLQQMDDFTWAGCWVLTNVKVQHFLELECNLQYIGCVISLSDQAGSALQNGWVRDCLTVGKLTWQQLTRMTWSGKDILCDPNLQVFLELAPNRDYISQIANFSDGAAKGFMNEWVRKQFKNKTLSWEQLANLSLCGSRVLIDPDIQVFLDQDQHKPYIGQVASFSFDAATALEDPWVRKHLTYETLSWQQLAGITWARDTFCNQEAQCFLEQKENLQHIGQVAGFSYDAGKVLRNPWVRNLINTGMLSWEQVSNLTKGGSMALINPEIQNFLEQGQYLQHINQIVLFSRHAPEALKNAWVRDCIVEESLSWTQLATITESGYRGLCEGRYAWVKALIVDGTLTLQQITSANLGLMVLQDRAVQLFLTQEQNKQYIPHVVNFSKHAGEALTIYWMRDQLRNGNLTCQHFYDMTESGKMVLQDGAVQHFLEQKENQPYIAQVASYSEYSAKALKNDWVRSCIASGILSFSQLANLTQGGSIVLTDLILIRHFFKNFFNQEQNQKCMDQIVSFSIHAAKTLKNAWVWKRVEDKNLTWTQLTHVTVGGSMMLRSPQVQHFLRVNENLEYLGQIVNFQREDADSLQNFAHLTAEVSEELIDQEIKNLLNKNQSLKNT
jgi:hypothetical protein